MKLRTTRAAACLIACMAAGLGTSMRGQSKPPVPPSDYAKWETLGMQPRGGLSPDGRWVAYGVARSNRDNELRIANVADGTVKTAAFGSQPVFSADSRYVAYGIGYSEAQEEKLRQQKKPIHRKLGIITLSSGEMTTIEGIESFAFNASGSHLLMKRYVPEPAPGTASGPAAADTSSAANDDPVGSTVIVRHLASGRDMTFGNVSELAWQDKGGLLALAISATDKSGNGVQLLDPESGTLRVLDSSASIYSGLTWRKNADDLVTLRSENNDRFDGPTHALLAWKGLSSSSARPYVYQPQTAKDFPAGMRTVSFRRPSWSDEGGVVFVGIAKWDEKPPSARSKTDNGDAAAEEREETATVDVWHARDVDVMPRQKISARTDRQRNLLSAWHVEAARFVQLATSVTERVAPLPEQKLAYAVNWSAYAMDRTIGRPAADLVLVDLDSGTRTKLQDRIEDQYLQVSPAGRYVLYLQGDQYWTIDTITRAAVNITRGAATSFVDRESDATVKQKPPFGVAGWTKNDAAVILYDRFDLWQAAADGSGVTRLTSGAADQVRHRYVRLDPDEDAIDTTKALHVALFGIWTKQSGYGRVRATPSSCRTSSFAPVSLGCRWSSA